MVKNLNKISKTNLSVSVTGIAGPKGGTKSKPVGLIYVGIKYKAKTKIYKKKFAGTRIQIQKKAVKYIFYILNKLI